MSDPISRQAVLELIKESISPEEYGCRLLYQSVEQMPSVQNEIIRCKDCKYFDLDHFEYVHGIRLIVAHEICMRWSDGVKTDQNGYCFLAERRKDV